MSKPKNTIVNLIVFLGFRVVRECDRWGGEKCRNHDQREAPRLRHHRHSRPPSRVRSLIASTRAAEASVGQGSITDRVLSIFEPATTRRLSGARNRSLRQTQSVA